LIVIRGEDKMKKIFGVLLTLILVLTIPVNAYAKTTNDTSALTTKVSQRLPKVYKNGDSIELKEGQKVRVMLGSETTQPTGIHTDGVITHLGNGGWVDLTRYSNSIHYNMFLNGTYTSVLCSAEIVDRTTGLSKGFMPIRTTVGEVPYTPVSGHQFAISINGYAYILTKPSISIYAYAYWKN
jgi:hypothetical protein